MKICFVQHEPFVGPGYYMTWAHQRKYDTQIVDCHRETPAPDLEQQFDMLVVLWGPQNPHTTLAECSHFNAVAERKTIQAFIASGRVVVGVCLGAQLIGEALGIQYEHSPEKEEGAVPVYLTEQGLLDPVLKDFQDGACLGEWHNDMMGVNSQTPVLAKSDGCPRQIVRYGTLVYGLQCHMELTPPDYQLLIEEMGTDVSHYQQYRYVQSAEQIRQIDCAAMNSNLAHFLDRLVGRYYQENK